MAHPVVLVPICPNFSSSCSNVAHLLCSWSCFCSSAASEISWCLGSMKVDRFVKLMFVRAFFQEAIMTSSPYLTPLWKIKIEKSSPLHFFRITCKYCRWYPLDLSDVDSIRKLSFNPVCILSYVPIQPNCEPIISRTVCWSQVWLQRPQYYIFCNLSFTLSTYVNRNLIFRGCGWYVYYSYTD